MKRLLILFFGCCVFILFTFVLLGDWEKWLELQVISEKSIVTYSLISFGCMALDTLLPVPSSLLMMLNGKLLGLFWGTILSLTSGLVASIISFYLGRQVNQYFSNFFSEQDKLYSNNLFQKFGNIAIVISKPLPIISEAISFVAGTTSISFKLFLFYSTIGHFVISVLYAWFGSFSNSFNSGLVTVLVMLLTVLCTWFIQFILKTKKAS